MKGSNLLEQGNGVSDTIIWEITFNAMATQACRRIETRTRLSVIDSQGFSNQTTLALKN